MGKESAITTTRRGSSAHPGPRRHTDQLRKLNSPTGQAPSNLLSYNFLYWFKAARSAPRARPGPRPGRAPVSAPLQPGRRPGRAQSKQLHPVSEGIHRVLQRLTQRGGSVLMAVSGAGVERSAGCADIAVDRVG